MKSTLEFLMGKGNLPNHGLEYLYLYLYIYIYIYIYFFDKVCLS